MTISNEATKTVIVYHAAFENTTYKAAVVSVPSTMSDEEAVFEAFRQTQNVHGSWSGPAEIRDEDLMTDFGANPDYRESVTVVGGRRDLSKSQRGFRSTSTGDVFLINDEVGPSRFFGLSYVGAVQFPGVKEFCAARCPDTPSDRMMAPFNWDKGVFA